MNGKKITLQDLNVRSFKLSHDAFEIILKYSKEGKILSSYDQSSSRYITYKLLALLLLLLTPLYTIFVFYQSSLYLYKTIVFYLSLTFLIPLVSYILIQRMFKNIILAKPGTNWEPYDENLAYLARIIEIFSLVRGKTNSIWVSPFLNAVVDSDVFKSLSMSLNIDYTPLLENSKKLFNKFNRIFLIVAFIMIISFNVDFYILHLIELPFDVLLFLLVLLNLFLLFMVVYPMFFIVKQSKRDYNLYESSETDMIINEFIKRGVEALRKSLTKPILVWCSLDAPGTLVISTPSPLLSISIIIPKNLIDTSILDELSKFVIENQNP